MSDSCRFVLRNSAKPAAVLIALAVVTLAIPGLVSPGKPEAEARSSSLSPLPARPSGRTRLEDIRPIVGFAINAHHIADLQLYLASVDRIAELNANSLIVLTPMIQRYVDSNRIEFVPEKCASDEQLVAILQHARQRGLYTTLLPIVLIENPGTKDWRGVIRPKNWDEWWSSYEQFIDRFINIANQGGVDLLMVGSELNSTESQLSRWTHIIDRVRSRFSGQIGYSANWDRYAKVELWSKVDVMAVSSYFELLRDDPDADEDELANAWTKERDALLAAAKRWNRPLLLSEVGYPSVPWASAHPWNYVVPAGAKADHEAQARCWRAFFKAWTGVIAGENSPASGFFGYFWSPYYHGDAWDTGYGINGKPAHAVVKDGFALIRSRASR